MTRCTCCHLSAFRWAEFPRPSIFATDKKLTSGASTGMTASQQATQSALKYTARTGRSLGSVSGISSVADRLIEQGNYSRRAGRA